MTHPLPAVLIGGPPHAGKSVLTYNLSQALRKRKIAHYVLRASPDGEGDWSQEMDQNIVDFVRIKGKWTPEFAARMCADLERRQVPLLVDAGGRPKDDQVCIVRNCSHAILLLHPDDEETIRRWRELVQVNDLSPLAQMYSELSGASTMTALEPVIEGKMAGLNRGISEVQGQLFEALVERISALFAPYTVGGLEKSHLSIAPVEYAVNLDALISDWAAQSGRWEPGMLSRLLQEVPAGTPLAVYGRGTNWIYGALALWSNIQPFHQFDIRLGWVTPPLVSFGSAATPAVRVFLDDYDDTTVLTVRLPNDYIDYVEAGRVSLPSVPAGRGFILSGKLPYWLVTAIARLYHSAGARWIACYQPPLNGAVVISSSTAAHSIGDLIPKFWTEPDHHANP